MDKYAFKLEHQIIIIYLKIKLRIHVIGFEKDYFTRRMT